MQPSITRFVAATAAIFVSACSMPATQAPPAPLPAAQGAPLQTCAELPKNFAFANTRLQSAARTENLAFAGQTIAPHCMVKGVMHERQGSDGRRYAIGFEMRLPQAWNGRFYYQANGGLDGVVAPALGALGGGPVTGALAQGFAVISSDAGHSLEQLPVFGFEPQARLDFGYQAIAKLTPMAKQLIQAAYGKPPDRSYIGGCSNGGRHALVTAARLGEHYDGYLAGAPGHRVPEAAIANMQGARLWAALGVPNRPNSSLPDVAAAFTPAEQHTVARAILARCDALDGVADGIVHATQACQAQFKVQAHVPTCTGERNGQCLTTAQKVVLETVFSGVQTAAGKLVYAPFPHDPGVAGKDWAGWKFDRSFSLNPNSVGTVFSVPPGPLDPLKDDLDAWLARTTATSAAFAESGQTVVGLPGEQNPVSLQAARSRGAKMVIYHGVADPIFSAEDTRRLVERIDTVQAGRGADFVRYFPVPGMNHCSGGPAADQFDLLSPLVAWVEQGIAPQAVRAVVRGAGNAGGVNTELPPGWSAHRTRPLCAHPSTAVYAGAGAAAVERAESFVCQ